MATWQNIRRGTLARRRVQLPLGQGPLAVKVSPDGGLRLSPPEGGVVEIDLRPLSSGEQGDVFAQARADAIARKVADPKRGDPIYDLCEMERTLLLCCVDPDSPPDAPRPLFASIDEIRGDALLGPDRVAYLFELFQQYQDECSPQRRHLTLEETLAAMLLLGGEEEGESLRFFESLGPALRWILLRTLAVQQRISQTPRSASSSPSAPRDSGSAAPAPPSPPTPAEG